MKTVDVNKKLAPQALSYPKMRLGRGWQIILWMTVSLIVLLGTGAAYQLIRTAADIHTYVPPGQLVDVGGYKMHIYCMGEGSPTIILDHVGAANFAQWALIQPTLAEHTHVCAYDRAGFGWSEPSSDPQDAAHNARQLHNLLNNAGFKGPFILVGHSYGGNVGRVFAATYPAETAGLVLIDPGKVLNRPGIPEDINQLWKDESALFMEIAPTLSRIGLIRLASDMGLAPGNGDLPSPQGEAFSALQVTNQFYDTLLAEHQALLDTSVQVLAAESQLSDLPLIVLSATQPDLGERERQIWTEVNASIAALSTNGVHREVAGSSHMSLAVSQEHAPITAEAILDILAAVRGERPLVTQP